MRQLGASWPCHTFDASSPMRQLGAISPRWAYSGVTSQSSKAYTWALRFPVDSRGVCRVPLLWFLRINEFTIRSSSYRAATVTEQAKEIAPLRCRQDDFQARSAFGTIAHRNLSAMLRDDAFGNRESEAGAVRVQSRGDKRVENLREHIGRNSGTVVLHRDHDRQAAVTRFTPRVDVDVTRRGLPRHDRSARGAVNRSARGAVNRSARGAVNRSARGAVNRGHARG